MLTRPEVTRPRPEITRPRPEVTRPRPDVTRPRPRPQGSRPRGRPFITSPPGVRGIRGLVTFGDKGGVKNSPRIGYVMNG